MLAARYGSLHLGHNILEKLGVGHRREAVKIAYRLGLMAEEAAPPPPCA